MSLLDSSSGLQKGYPKCSLACSGQPDASLHKLLSIMLDLQWMRFPLGATSCIKLIPTIINQTYMRVWFSRAYSLYKIGLTPGNPVDAKNRGLQQGTPLNPTPVKRLDIHTDVGCLTRMRFPSGFIQPSPTNQPGFSDAQYG